MNDDDDDMEIDISKIVDDLLHENLSPDITSSAGVGGDNMTCILIVFKKHSLPGATEPKVQTKKVDAGEENKQGMEEKKETAGTGEQD